MRPDLDRRTFPTSPPARLVAVIIVACAGLLSTSGCDQIEARRKIQEAGKLYQRGDYAKAAELYEDVLATFDQGEVSEVAHYNAGITYNKLFRPGVTTPENLELAAAATRHFASYLELHPEDAALIGLMTQVWMDAGQYGNAIQYWEREHAKDPKDSEIISIIAGIHRQSGQWEKAIEWHYKEADVLGSPEAKASAYSNVGKLTSNKLFNRTQVFWEERMRVADIGIEALQKAQELTPDNPELHTYLGILYSLRAEAHQAAWAQVIDRSQGLYHHGRATALKRIAEGKPAEPEPEKAPEPAANETSDGEPGGERGEQNAPEKPAEEGAAPPAKPTESASAAAPAPAP